MAQMKGPVKLILTLEATIDTEGRMSMDWSAEAEVPKGVEAPTIGLYTAKQIMECAEHCMELKESLNWQVHEVPKTPAMVDQLP